MQPDHLERRVFTRIDLPGQVIVTDGPTLRTGALRDISLAGLLVDFGTGWSPSPGGHHEVEVLLAPDVSIRLTAHIVHVCEYCAGLTVERIDLDSICRLRRLVELNLGDCDLLDRELTALSRG